MTVLVAGVARSGTSWLGDMVASLADSRLLFEPFVVGRDGRLLACYPANRPPTPQDRWPNCALSLERTAPASHRQDIEAIVKGRCVHGEFEPVPGRPAPGRWRRSNRSLTIKAIRANFMFRYLAPAFPAMPTVFTVRDPVSVVNSMVEMNKLNWRFDLDLDCLRSQASLWERLAPWHGLIESARPLADRLAIRWCVENRIALDDLRGVPRALVLDYHDFTLERRGLDELLTLLKEETQRPADSVRARAGDLFGRASRTRSRKGGEIRSGREALANLDAAQVGRIRSYAETFGLQDFVRDDAFWRKRGARFLAAPLARSGGRTAERPVTVSVVIPTRNRADLLGRAIRSVLTQRYEDFELLVVDGDSSDATDLLMESFADGRIRYIKTEHRGISHSLNLGLSRARGKYIARLDSDDEWLPDMLSELTAVLDERPDIGLVYARARGMDAAGKDLDDCRGVPLWFPGDSFKSMLYGDVTCNIALLARRCCLDKTGLFDTSLEIHEDWDLWTRLSRHYEFHFHDRVLARFRMHGGNTTASCSPEHAARIDQRIRILDKAYAEPGLPDGAREVKPMAYANAHIWMGSDWLHEGKPGRALSHFRQAWKARGYAPGAFLDIVWGIAARNVLWKYNWGRRLTLNVNRIARSRYRRTGCKD